MDVKDAETWIEDNASTVGGVIFVVLVVIIIILLVIIYRSIFNKKVNSGFMKYGICGKIRIILGSFVFLTKAHH